MNRNEIIARLMENDSTVLSFPDRGPWGDPKYRGNCSGWYQAFLIWKYKVKKFAELFAGSGTGFDVAKDMKIGYVGADLNPTPVRPGILCVNAVTDEVPIQFTDADFLFMHPPYGAEIRIPYAGSMYPDPSGELSKCDLGADAMGNIYESPKRYRYEIFRLFTEWGTNGNLNGRCPQKRVTFHVNGHRKTRRT